MTTTPVRLSDQQLDAVMAAAYPLPPDRRSKFLEEVARAVAGLPEVGDGVLHRTIMEVQRKHFNPPQFATDNGASKYSRQLRRARTG